MKTTISKNLHIHQYNKTLHFNKNLNTTYDSLYHSHGYLLRSQTFISVCIDCFVAKLFLI